MATKTIDVTLATIRNTGSVKVSPRGVIGANSCRAGDDNQVFQAEDLYVRLESGQPIHPNGATHIPPGQSLTYNVTKRLEISNFEHESDGHLNQMLELNVDLTQHVNLSEPDDLHYFGPDQKVLFDELDGFDTIDCPYNTAPTEGYMAKMIVTFTVNLISSSG